MGTSTDAILFYGYACWYDESELFGDWFEQDWWEPGEATWEDAWARLNGTQPPTIEYTGNERVYEKYWDTRSKLAAECPVTMGTHCSYDYPMPYVAITESVRTAHRGHPKKLSRLDLQANECRWFTQLKDFMDLMQLTIPENAAPGWTLVSLWG